MSPCCGPSLLRGWVMSFQAQRKIQGEASPPLLPCLLVFFLKLERKSKAFAVIRSLCLCLSVGGKWSCLSAGSLDGVRSGLTALLPGVGVSNTWCHSTMTVWLKPLAGKSRHSFVLFCPRVAGAASPPSRVLGWRPCAVSHHTTLLGQGMLPWSLSCPVEVVGIPEDTLFTLAETLEQPEGQISIFMFYILIKLL